MPELHVEIDGHVATVTLDDPDRRNALNASIWSTRSSPPSTPSRPTTRRRGGRHRRGPAFCAGADLSHLGSSRARRPARHLRGLPARRPVAAAHHRRGQRRRRRRRHEPGPRLRRAPGRRVGPVRHRGSCSSASTPAAATPGCCSGSSARRPPRAMVLFGEVLDGAAAAEAGLVWRCVADADLLDAAHGDGRHGSRRRPTSSPAAPRRTMRRRARRSTTTTPPSTASSRPSCGRWTSPIRRTPRRPATPHQQEDRSEPRQSTQSPSSSSTRGARPTPRR